MVRTYYDTQALYMYVRSTHVDSTAVLLHLGVSSTKRARSET
jgi:hypothetical protein